MFNPFRFSDYFIPMSNYFSRKRKIFWRKLTYTFKKKTYLEKLIFKSRYSNKQGYLEISYAFNNLIYAKVEDLYFFESEKSFLINLKNYPFENFSILFKGLKDQEEITFELKDYILTNFEEFHQTIQLKQTSIINHELKFFQLNVNTKIPIIDSNQIKIDTNKYRINSTKFNKEDYVK